MQLVDQIKASLAKDIERQEADLVQMLEDSGGRETFFIEGWRKGLEILRGCHASLDDVTQITEDQDKVLRRAALEQAAIIERADIATAEVNKLVKDATTPKERLALIEAELAKKEDGGFDT